MKPLISPEPKLAHVSSHPSSATLQAVHTGNRVTTIWGAIASIMIGALGVGAKLYTDHQDRASDDLAAKHAALEQKVSDLKEADRDAHQRIEESIKVNREHGDDRFDRLEGLMLKGQKK